MSRLFSGRAIAVVKRIVGTLGASALVVVMLASPAEADPPTVVTYESTYQGEDPCTGAAHAVSETLTSYQHFHDDRFVAHGVVTITTTPTGYSGGGTTTGVESEGLLALRATFILTNEAGSRIMYRAVWVEDLATGTVKVQMNELTCVQA
jgi:hypothetical protein